MKLGLSGAQWRKSSYSGNTGNCVEVVITDQAIGVRDSKNPDGGVLSVTPSAWRAFIRSLKRKDFDT